MKILHGMSEVAGQGIYTVKGLRENGYETNMVVWRKNIGGYDVDIDLKIGNQKFKYPVYAAKMACFAIKALMKYDVYHFHYGYSLIPYHFDLPIIKLLKKDYYTEFHGSEIRFLFNSIEYEYIKGHWDISEIKKKAQKRLKKLLKDTKGIILHDVELIKHLPDGIDVPIYIVPLRVDIRRFEPSYSQETEKPIIVHAPSNRSTKGTDQILIELEKINSEFELILVEGKTQEEAFEIYKKSDIIIDQISGGTYGVFAIEGMALSKPVITYIDDEMRDSFPSSLPIVSCQFSDLAQKIDELIKDSELRYNLGVAGRKYVERYHDNVKVTKFLGEIYDNRIADNNLFKLL